MRTCFFGCLMGTSHHLGFSPVLLFYLLRVPTPTVYIQRSIKLGQLVCFLAMCDTFIGFKEDQTMPSGLPLGSMALSCNVARLVNLLASQSSKHMS